MRADEIASVIDRWIRHSCTETTVSRAALPTALLFWMRPHRTFLLRPEARSLTWLIFHVSGWCHLSLPTSMSGTPAHRLPYPAIIHGMNV